jgi:hypothetical protein
LKLVKGGHPLWRSRASERERREIGKILALQRWERLSEKEALEEIRPLFSGPLRYLNRGAQSYVFLTADGEHVVKFFRFDQAHNPLRYWYKRWVKGKERSPADLKLWQLLTSAWLAYREAKDLTGLMYVHLIEGGEDLPQAVLIDPLGRRHTIRLSEYRFVVQKRADRLDATLQRALSQGGERALQERIDQFFALLVERTKRKIGNSDRATFRNIGFIANRAIEIDFGNFYVNDFDGIEAKRREEIFRFCAQLEKWLARHAPESLPYLESWKGRIERGEA